MNSKASKTGTSRPSPTIGQVIRRGCITVPGEMLAAESVKLMQERKINGLIVVDKQNRPIGAFNMHDVLKAGVI